jgi:hypothetical protein
MHEMQVRSHDDLQHAHDLLVGIILHNVPFPDVGLTMRDLNLMAQVLCWALRHEHNEQFQQMLERIERGVAEQGYALEPFQ